MQSSCSEQVLLLHSTGKTERMMSTIQTPREATRQQRSAAQMHSIFGHLLLSTPPRCIPAPPVRSSMATVPKRGGGGVAWAVCFSSPSHNISASRSSAHGSTSFKGGPAGLVVCSHFDRVVGPVHLLEGKTRCGHGRRGCTRLGLGFPLKRSRLHPSQG